MIWPDGNPAESLMDHVYQVVKKILGYAKKFARQNVDHFVKKDYQVPDHSTSA